MRNVKTERNTEYFDGLSGYGCKKHDDVEKFTGIIKLVYKQYQKSASGENEELCLTSEESEKLCRMIEKKLRIN